MIYSKLKTMELERTSGGQLVHLSLQTTSTVLPLVSLSYLFQGRSILPLESISWCPNWVSLAVISSYYFLPNLPCAWGIEPSLPSEQPITAVLGHCYAAVSQHESLFSSFILVTIYAPLISSSLGFGPQKYPWGNKNEFEPALSI